MNFMQKFIYVFEAPSQHTAGATIKDDILLYAGQIPEERFVSVKSVCVSLGLDFIFNRNRVREMEPVCRGYRVIESEDKKISVLHVDYMQVWLCSLRGIHLKSPKWVEKLYFYQLKFRQTVDAIFDRYFKAKQDPNVSLESVEKIANDKRWADIPIAVIPPKSPRIAISELIRAYSKRHNIPFNHVWRTLYRHVNYHLRHDLLQMSRKRGKPPLDIAEEIGIIEQVWTLAYHYFLD